jgi:hypothetical protein
VSDELDRELARAFSGITAPARLASSVMHRVRTPAPTPWPEVLGTIGWMGILSLAASVAFFVILK